MVTTSVQLPDELMKRLESTAHRLHRPAGAVINDALCEYLDREERRAQRLAATREALAEVDAGDLIDGDEVLAWIDSWGTPGEREPPR